MHTAKTFVIGAAFSGVMVASTMALEVGFNPETVYFLSRVAGDSFEQEEAFYPDANGGTVVLDNHGVRLESTLEVVRGPDMTTVRLGALMALGAEGNLAQTEFAGEFHLSEPAYVQFFGQMGNDALSPDAVCFLYGARGALDTFDLQYEYDYQFGQTPELIGIDGMVEGMSYREGAIQESQWLPAGSYFFVLQLSAWDNALTADTSFDANGVAGFTIVDADAQFPEPLPEPANLGDLLEAVEAFAAEGQIQGGVANALKAKIHQAIRAQERGEHQQAQLTAFGNQVEAQAGKHVSTEAAESLLQLVQAIQGGW